MQQEGNESSGHQCSGNRREIRETLSNKYRRRNTNEKTSFDIQPHSEGKGERIRLRQQGEKTTLTYKNRNGNDIGATKELETEVKDFDAMAEILQKLKRNVTAYQENKRKIYSFNNIEFCLDTRPKIPTYLEIESSDVKKVKEGLELLGLTGKDEGEYWRHRNLSEI